VLMSLVDGSGVGKFTHTEDGEEDLMFAYESHTERFVVDERLDGFMLLPRTSGERYLRKWRHDLIALTKQSNEPPPKSLETADHK
jgi:hypothetical protein